MHADDMRLSKVRFMGDPAYLWTSPNGTPFYLQRCLHSSKWVWWRSERDVTSSQHFPSLQALKEHLAIAFSED